MKKVLLAISMIATFILPSCSVWNSTTNRTMLQDNFSYIETELHGSDHMEGKPFSWDISLGYAEIQKPGLDISDDDYKWDPGIYNPDLYDQNYSGLKFGLTPTWYFSKDRFQPFLGCGFNAVFFMPRETGEDTIALDSYFYVLPNAGIRIFFTRRFGIHAKVGYSIGKINHPGISLEKASGLSYAYGLTLTF
jgi:hypothetical protein